MAKTVLGNSNPKFNTDEKKKSIKEAVGDIRATMQTVAESKPTEKASVRTTEQAEKRRSEIKSNIEILNKRIKDRETSRANLRNKYVAQSNVGASVPQYGLNFEESKMDDEYINRNSPFGTYRITSKTGSRNTNIQGATKNHAGLDRAVPEGTEISLPMDTVFRSAGYDKARGNWIEVADKNGNILHFQHLQDFGTFKNGETIAKGQIIARSGSSGVGTAHLHEEYYSPDGRNITESYWSKYAAKDEGNTVKSLFPNGVTTTDEGALSSTGEKVSKKRQVGKLFAAGARQGWYGFSKDVYSFADMMGEWAEQGLNSPISKFVAKRTAHIPTFTISRALVKGMTKALDSDFFENKVLGSQVKAYNKATEDAREAINSFSGKGGRIAGEVVVSFCDNSVRQIPTLVLAALTGGTSTVGTGAAAVGNTSSQAMGKMTTLLQNPQFWNSYIQQSGGSYFEAKESGATEKQSLIAANVSGFINAAIEVSGGIEKAPVPENTQGFLKSFWRAAKEAAPEEALEEGLQDGVENLVNKMVYKRNAPLFSTSDEDAVYNPIRMSKNMAMGGLLGGIYGGGNAVVGKALSGRSADVGEVTSDQSADVGKAERGTETVKRVIGKGLSENLEKMTSEDVSKVKNAVANIQEKAESGIYDNMSDAELANDGDVAVVRKATELTGDKQSGAKIPPPQAERINPLPTIEGEPSGAVRYSVSGDGKITASDITAVQAVGRKSVNDFTSGDVKATESFAKKYYKEIGTKSPFFRAWFGDWRANDKSPVKVAREKGSARGVTKNNDTGWDIQVSGKVFAESKHKAVKNTSAVPYLDYINSIVENAVLLDSHTISEEKAKTGNSALMHSLYSIADMGKGGELVKLYVEELRDINTDGTINRAYQLQNIKSQQLKSSEFGQNPSSIIPTADVNSIADLFALVKQNDKNFKSKLSSKVVNADGTPKVVYHGTSESFNVFDITKSRSYDETLNYDLPGFYFSESADESGSYGGNLKAYYIDIKNPYLGDVYSLQKEKGSYRKAYEYLVQQGYDGVIVDDMGEGFNEYIVFKPEQIKAVDNTGTFDVRNPDVRYSREQTQERQSQGEVLNETQRKFFSGFGISVETDESLDANAKILLCDGKVIVSPYAKVSGWELVRHEFTHQLKTTAPEAYELYTRIARSEIGEDWETAYSEVERDYAEYIKKKSGREITANEIEEEVYARYAEGLDNNAFMERVATENVTLAARIRNLLKNIISRIKAMFARGYVKQGDAETVEKLVAAKDAWERAVIDAARGRAKRYENPTTASGADKSAPYDTRGHKKSGKQVGVRYSIVQIKGSKGDYGIGVYLDTNLFEGIKTRNWGRKLGEFVYKNLAGKTMAVYNDDGAREIIQFARENESVKKDGAKNSHRVIDKIARKQGNVQALSIVHIDELLETSKTESRRGEHNHQWLDENGWEFRKTYIQDIKGRIYEATLNIANARDGRKILYDITNIKEVDSGVIPKTYNKGGSRSPTSTSAYSISQDGGNVKGEEKATGGADKSAPYDRGRTEGDIRYSENHPYTYDRLISNDDMNIVAVSEKVQRTTDGKIDRDGIKTAGMKNAFAVGKKVNEHLAVVKNRYSGKDIAISWGKIGHSLDRRKAVAAVIPKIGEVVQNGIRVNEMLGGERNVDTSYPMVSIAQNENGETIAVLMVVNDTKNGNPELVDMGVSEVLYSANAKKEPFGIYQKGNPIGSDNRLLRKNARTTAKNAAHITDYKVSIADALDIVKNYFPDVLSDDVLSRYGIEKNTNSKYTGVRYSVSGEAENEAEHTPEMKRIMAEYENAVDDNLTEFAEYAKAHPNDNKTSYVISEVSDRAAADIKDKTGIDVSGFDHCIKTNSIRHIEKRHGANGESDQSMRDIKDVARIGYVMENYDDVEVLDEVSKEYRDKEQKPAPIVRYSKRVDGKYYAVEAVTDTKKHQLAVVTAYKKTAEQQTRDVQAPTRNVRNASADAVEDIIYQDGGNVKGEEKATGGADKSVPTKKRENKGKSGEKKKKTHRKAVSYYIEKLEEDNAELRNANNLLKEMYEKTTEVKVDALHISEIAEDVKKRYESHIPTKDIGARLQEIYTKMTEDGANADSAEQKATAAQNGADALFELAREIVESSDVVDKTMWDTYAELRHDLRTVGISIAPEDAKDIPDFNDFRKRNMGRVKITKDGTRVDSYYEELLNEYPELFASEDITAPSDRLLKIVKVRDMLDPKYRDKSYTDEEASALAVELYTEYFSDKNAAYEQQSLAKMIKEKYAKVLRDEYDKKLKQTERHYIEQVEFYKNKSEKVGERIVSIPTGEQQRERYTDIDYTKKFKWFDENILDSGVKFVRRRSPTGRKNTLLMTFERPTREKLRENSEYAEVIKRVQERLAENWESGKGGTGSGKYQATNIWRNFRLFFGDKDYAKMKKLVLDPFEDSKRQMMYMTDFYTQLIKKKVVDELGIKKGSKLSEFVQKYGEGVLTPDELAEITPENMEKIKKADSIFRACYDGLIDTVNDTRRAIYPGAEERAAKLESDIVALEKEIGLIELGFMTGDFSDVKGFNFYKLENLEIKKMNAKELAQRISRQSERRSEELRKKIEEVEEVMAATADKTTAKYVELEKKLDKYQAQKSKWEALTESELAELEGKIADLSDEFTSNTEIQKQKLKKKLGEMNERLKRKKQEAESEEIVYGRVIQKRKNYYRHFEEMAAEVPAFFGYINQLTKTEGMPVKKAIQTYFNDMGNREAIDSRLAGRSADTKPRSKWQSFAQHRAKEPKIEVTYDAVGGLLEYLPAATYSATIDPQISIFRSIAEDLAAGGNKRLNGFIGYLNEYSNDLAGKTHVFDRWIADSVGRDTMNKIHRLTGKIRGNMVSFNLSSALAQCLNLPNGIALVGNPIYVADGAFDTVKGAVVKSGEVAERYKRSQFLNERFSDFYSQFDVGALANVKKFSNFLLSALDEVSTRIIWNSAYRKGVKIGEESPIRYADDITRRAVGGRGIGELQSYQKSKLVGFFLPFTVESSNSLSVWRDIVLDAAQKGRGNTGMRKVAITSGELLKKALALLIADWVFNMLLEELRGSDGGLFDPIADVIDGVKNNDSIGKIMGSIAGDALGATPAGETIAGLYPEYGIEIVGSLKTPTRAELFGSNDPTRYGTSNILTSGVENIPYLLMPAGGGQIIKTSKAVETLVKGAAVNRKGKTLYEVDGTDPANVVKGVMFGKSALKETADYYDKKDSADIYNKYIKTKTLGKKTEQEKELARIIKIDEKVKPSSPGKSFKVNNVEYTPTGRYYKKYEEMYGRRANQYYNKVMLSDEYKAANDYIKRDMLKEAFRTAKKDAQKAYVTWVRNGAQKDGGSMQQEFVSSFEGKTIVGDNSSGSLRYETEWFKCSESYVEVEYQDKKYILQGMSRNDYEKERYDYFKKEMEKMTASGNITIQNKTKSSSNNKTLKAVLVQRIIEGAMTQAEAQAIYDKYRSGEAVEVPAGVEFVLGVQEEYEVKPSELTKNDLKNINSMLSKKVKKGEMTDEEAHKYGAEIQSGKRKYTKKRYITGDFNSLTVEQQKKVAQALNNQSKKEGLRKIRKRLK